MCAYLAKPSSTEKDTNIWTKLIAAFEVKAASEKRSFSDAALSELLLCF